jgi:hypothetical protein|tara:strand:+ start:1467 stop:1748 length:282 start_codon:yes stop_codon:yes gene_type:complete
MNPLIPLAAIGAAAFYGTRGRRAHDVDLFVIMVEQVPYGYVVWTDDPTDEEYADTDLVDFGFDELADAKAHARERVKQYKQDGIPAVLNVSLD